MTLSGKFLKGEKQAVAKKVHYCDLPGCIIKKGETYINFFSKRPGRPFVKKKYHPGHRQNEEANVS